MNLNNIVYSNTVGPYRLHMKLGKPKLLIEILGTPYHITMKKYNTLPGYDNYGYLMQGCNIVVGFQTEHIFESLYRCAGKNHNELYRGRPLIEEFTIDMFDDCNEILKFIKIHENEEVIGEFDVFNTMDSTHVCPSCSQGGITAIYHDGIYTITGTNSVYGETLSDDLVRVLGFRYGHMIGFNVIHKAKCLISGYHIVNPNNTKSAV